LVAGPAAAVSDTDILPVSRVKTLPLWVGFRQENCQSLKKCPLFASLYALAYLMLGGGGGNLCNVQPKTIYQNMSKVNFKPNEDRVLVEPAEAESKTASGIIIPDTAKEKPQKGKVIAVGEGLKDKPVTVKVGDNVLYGKYAGTEITLDGKEYLIMRNSDIFGTI